MLLQCRLCLAAGPLSTPDLMSLSCAFEQLQYTVLLLLKMVTLKEMKTNKSRYFKSLSVSHPSAWRIWFDFFQPRFIVNVFVSHFRVFKIYKCDFFSFSTLKGVIHYLQTSVVFWWEIRNYLYFSHCVIYFLSASFVALLCFHHFTVMS